MILKFQSGGLTAPWVLYTPLSINTASPRTNTEESSSRKSSSKGDSDSGKLTEKDLLGILKDMKILPSDSKLILPKLERFIRLQDMGDNIDPAAIAIQFIRSLQEIKNAEYRREAFEEAYKKVDKEGGLNEFAVNVSGELAVLNKENGEISFVTLDNLDTLNYRPLTNSDVLRLRAEEFGNADALTQLASNGVGMEKISQRINTLFHTLGKDEISNDGYTRSPEAHVMNLLRSKVLEIKSSTDNEQVAQELYDAARLQIGEGISLKGLYKYTESNSTSNRQLGEALQYIYNGLLPNERTILDLRSGGKKGDGIKAITHMLISTSSTNYKFDLDMLENENGVKPGTKESSDTLNRSLDPVTGFIAGMGYLEQAKINIGNSISFVVNGRYSSLVDKSGNPLKPNSTLLDVLGSAFQGVLDTRFLYMGDQLIDGDRTKVLIDDANIIRVDLPINKELKKKGIVSPDLSLSLKIEDAEFDIKTKNITDEEEINKVYNDHELPNKYIKTDKGWNLNQYDWTSFAMIAASAEESAFSDPDSVTLPEITNEGKKNEIISTLKLNDKDYSVGFWGTDFYHGYIFIPVKDDYVAASYSSGNYMKVPGNNAIDIAEKQALQLQYAKPVDVRK